MNQSPTQLMSKAVRSGDVAAAQTLLAQHSSLLHAGLGANSWLYVAAEYDNVAMVELLVSSGLDVTGTPGRPTPLGNAARSGSVQVAKWLLDHGAQVDHLIGAVNSGSLELVRLLVERGADVHAVYGKPPRNALSHAVARGYTAIADYLRSQGTTMPDAGPAAPPTFSDEIVRHVEKYIGPANRAAWTEVVPTPLGLRVHLVPADAGRDYQTLFTTGMSNVAMDAPDSHARLRHAELLLHLPASWPLTPEALVDSAWRWPIEVLRRAALHPHQLQRVIGIDLVGMSTGEPPEPLAPGLPFDCVLFVAGEPLLPELQLQDGRVVHFYRIVPLHPSERQRVGMEGVVRFIRRFPNQQIPLVVDVERQPIV